MATKKDLLKTLKERFESHPERHPGILWETVSGRLTPGAVASLSWMEETGGEPDVIGYDPETDSFIFADCSKETPAGRRSVCYDGHSRTTRKKNAPATSAWESAETNNVCLLNEEDYRKLQELGEFDLKTSCWIDTPEEIRKAGGALFAERRYGKVFIFHNGADSYYSVRGFRTKLSV